MTVIVGYGHSKTVRVGDPSTCRSVSTPVVSAVFIEYVELLPWSVFTERLALEEAEDDDVTGGLLPGVDEIVSKGVVAVFKKVVE